MNPAQHAQSKAALKVLRKHILQKVRKGGRKEGGVGGRGRGSEGEGEGGRERVEKGKIIKELTLAIFTKWLRISALIFKVCAVRISRTTQKLTCRVKHTYTHTYTHIPEKWLNTGPPLPPSPTTDRDFPEVSKLEEHSLGLQVVEGSFMTPSPANRSLLQHLLSNTHSVPRETSTFLIIRGNY